MTLTGDGILRSQGLGFGVKRGLGFRGHGIGAGLSEVKGLGLTGVRV